MKITPREKGETRDFHACSRFASSTIPEEKLGLKSRQHAIGVIKLTVFFKIKVNYFLNFAAVITIIFNLFSVKRDSRRKKIFFFLSLCIEKNIRTVS